MFRIRIGYGRAGRTYARIPVGVRWPHPLLGARLYSLRFAIRRVEPTPSCPHGLSYSFTLHDPHGRRLVGFDNAHRVPAAGGRFKKGSRAADHWHRTETDKGRPY